MPCDIGPATTLLWAFISSSKEAGYQLSGVFLRSGFIKEVTGCFQVVLSLQEPGWDGGRGFAGMRVGLVEPIRVLCVCVCVCVCLLSLGERSPSWGAELSWEAGVQGQEWGAWFIRSTMGLSQTFS